MAKQTQYGKAFEYACVEAIKEFYSGTISVEVVESEPMETARSCFNARLEEQDEMLTAARAAIKVIDKYEPRLAHPQAEEPLYIELQPDSAGRAGDVRDVLCSRPSEHWSIGISCKHNHDAVKHSRLSATVDFGDIWLGHPCSSTYFSHVVPLFNSLSLLKEQGDETGAIAMWSDLNNKEDDYYVPVLESFMGELNRLYKTYPDVPENLIRYLLGRHDFYKVISDGSDCCTRVIAVNVNGTLGCPVGDFKPASRIRSLPMPKKFFHIGFKEVQPGVESKTTVQVVCDEGWDVAMRLHNASSRIEPSLKFDVRLVSRPAATMAETEPWKS